MYWSVADNLFKKSGTYGIFKMLQMRRNCNCVYDHKDMCSEGVLNRYEVKHTKRTMVIMLQRNLWLYITGNIVYWKSVIFVLEEDWVFEENYNLLLIYFSQALMLVSILILLEFHCDLMYIFFVNLSHFDELPLTPWNRYLILHISYVLRNLIMGRY